MSSDSTLRELERAAPGDPAAEERWIVARLRAGALSEERLHFMRLLGHEGAARLLSRSHDPFVFGPSGVLSAVAHRLRDQAMIDATMLPTGSPVHGPWLVPVVAYAVELCALAQARWCRIGKAQHHIARARFTDLLADHPPHKPGRCDDPVCDSAIRCQRAARQWLEGSTIVRPALFALSAMAGAPVGDSPAVGPLWVWLPARLACGLSVENLPSLHGVCMDLGVQPQAMLDAARGPLIAWCLS